MTPEKLIAFQRNHVISNAVPDGDVINVRVLSDRKPEENARNAEPNLEDAYLYEFNYGEEA